MEVIEMIGGQIGHAGCGTGGAERVLGARGLRGEQRERMDLDRRGTRLHPAAKLLVVPLLEGAAVGAEVVDVQLDVDDLGGVGLRWNRFLLRLQRGSLHRLEALADLDAVAEHVLGSARRCRREQEDDGGDHREDDDHAAGDAALQQEPAAAILLLVQFAELACSLSCRRACGIRFGAGVIAVGHSVLVHDRSSGAKLPGSPGMSKRSARPTVGTLSGRGPHEPRTRRPHDWCHTVRMTR
jgi:hypothetical protein